MKEHAEAERIISDPAVCGGQSCFRGTRVPVHVVLDFLAAGDSVEDILAEYPQLRREDIQAALAFAARLAREESEPWGAHPEVVPA